MQRFVRSSACLVNNAVKFSIQRNNVQIPRRFISESSWAADKLQEAGEVLTPREGGDIIVNDDMINQPSDNIKALAEQFLELNAIEAAQLLKVIQVYFVAYIYMFCIYIYLVYCAYFSSTC